jgi:hypothetical protein
LGVEILAAISETLSSKGASASSSITWKQRRAELMAPDSASGVAFGFTTAIAFDNSTTRAN